MCTCARPGVLLENLQVCPGSGCHHRRKVMMWDDLCLGGVLGNRHGSTNICAVVRSIFGERGGRTITVGRIGSSSRAIERRGVGSFIV